MADVCFEANGTISVVVADDVKELRMLFELALELDPRFEVVGKAADGREAVDLVKAHQPDVLLLDVSMPVMGGLEALPRVRDVAPRTVVVMLSGFDESRLKDQALALGASAFLEKGLSPDRLVAELSAIVESSSL
jgi:DNA-binding NarL/FixJ family response regulator